MIHRNRVKSFFELGKYFAETEFSKLIREKLKNKDPIELDRIKHESAKRLRYFLSLKKSKSIVSKTLDKMGYLNALISIDGATVCACRMGVDHWNYSGSKVVEAQRNVEECVDEFCDMEGVPRDSEDKSRMKIELSAQSNIAGSYPGLEGKRFQNIRELYGRRTSSILRYVKIRSSEIYRRLVKNYERLQLGYMISNKHEYEELEDLDLANETVDVIDDCMECNTMEKISKCEKVKKLIKINKFKKVISGIYYKLGNVHYKFHNFTQYLYQKV